jgi:Uma2 family endonuclease
MSTLLSSESIQIPLWVINNNTFLRWACSDEFPERGRLSFLNGEVRVDMSPEELYTHNRLKGEFATALTTVVKGNRLGQFFHDRTLLTHRAIGLSTEPDGMFISFDSIRSKRVRKVRGAVRGYKAWAGSPDMVLEVVSDSSVYKDTVELKSLYWEAGIAEYWLVDGRQGEDFAIFRHQRTGYAPATKRAGWHKSEVFHSWFKLGRRTDEVGDPEYNLEIRPTSASS